MYSKEQCLHLKIEKISIIKNVIFFKAITGECSVRSNVHGCRLWPKDGVRKIEGALPV